jgi:hypothetical protein
MISVKVSTIIFKALNFECIIFNNIFFTYFRLQPSELNDIFNLVKKIISDFLLGKIRGRLIFGIFLYAGYYVRLTYRCLVFAIRLQYFITSVCILHPLRGNLFLPSKFLSLSSNIRTRINAYIYGY